MSYFRIRTNDLWDRRKIKWLALLLALGSCAQERQPFSLLGAWTGTEVTITDSSRNESVTEPVKRFGYLNFEVHKDSTFRFDMAVLKDVTTERSMFGISQNVVLIKAVYTTSRFGSLSRQDTDFMCNTKEGVIFVSSDSTNRELIARFRDESQRNWSCILVKRED